jgi:hypothetical protein
MEVEDAAGGWERSECVAIPLEVEEDRLNSSTPYAPSGFLCPSNLGALLESTTVSLVGWKETREVVNRLNGELQSDEVSSDLDMSNKTSLQGSCTCEK